MAIERDITIKYDVDGAVEATREVTRLNAAIKGTGQDATKADDQLDSFNSSIGRTASQADAAAEGVGGLSKRLEDGLDPIDKSLKGFDKMNGVLGQVSNAAKILSGVAFFELGKQLVETGKAVRDMVIKLDGGKAAFDRLAASTRNAVREAQKLANIKLGAIGDIAGAVGGAGVLASLSPETQLRGASLAGRLTAAEKAYLETAALIPIQEAQLAEARAKFDEAVQKQYRIGPFYQEEQRARKALKATNDEFLKRAEALKIVSAEFDKFVNQYKKADPLRPRKTKLKKVAGPKTLQDLFPEVFGTLEEVQRREALAPFEKFAGQATALTALAGGADPTFAGIVKEQEQKVKNLIEFQRLSIDFERRAIPLLEQVVLMQNIMFGVGRGLIGRQSALRGVIGGTQQGKDLLRFYIKGRTGINELIPPDLAKDLADIRNEFGTAAQVVPGIGLGSAARIAGITAAAEGFKIAEAAQSFRELADETAVTVDKLKELGITANDLNEQELQLLRTRGMFPGSGFPRSRAQGMFQIGGITGQLRGSAAARFGKELQEYLRPTVDMGLAGAAGAQMFGVPLQQETLFGGYIENVRIATQETIAYLNALYEVSDVISDVGAGLNTAAGGISALDGALKLTTETGETWARIQAGVQAALMSANAAAATAEGLKQLAGGFITPPNPVLATANFVAAGAYTAAAGLYAGVAAGAIGIQGQGGGGGAGTTAAPPTRQEFDTGGTGETVINVTVGGQPLMTQQDVENAVVTSLEGALNRRGSSARRRISRAIR